MDQRETTPGTDPDRQSLPSTMATPLAGSRMVTFFRAAQQQRREAVAPIVQALEAESKETAHQQN